MDRIVLVLKGSAEQDAELEQLLAQQQDPASPVFRKWLTPEQFGERFGPSLQDIDVISQWLRGHGMRVDGVSNGRREIEFSGTAKQLEDAFHTEIHRYESDGAMHLANAGDISIPQALTPVVRGVVSMNDFPLPSMMSRVERSDRRNDSLQPADNFSNGQHGIAPYDFATIYNIAPLWNQSIDGTGQSIAIVGRTNIKVNDVTNFRSRYGLPPNDPQIILNGNDPGIVSQDEEVEADLDVEWSGAVAKGASIKFVVSGRTNGTDGVVLSAIYIVNHNTAPILSMSFGACEAASPSAPPVWSSLWEQAAAEGISVFVSSGDNGSAGCDDPSTTAAVRGFGVNGAASTPYNVAVGGTQFNENGMDSLYWESSNSVNLSSAKSYIPEIVWNESTGGLWGSGGGVSAVFPTPSWQTGLGVPTVDPGTTNQHHRYLPDVSLTAALHDGYVILAEGATELVAGTSASAPAFAGLMALINQTVNGASGNPNPGFYSIAAHTESAFHDTTSGSNAVPCATGSANCLNGRLSGYSAGVGYDLATGLGSVDAFILVQAWSAAIGITPLGPALSITSHTPGQAVSTTTITISGTATDAGRGDDGVSSVTVNGIRADNDTAAGQGTANWSKAISLSAGSNVITVVATDNSTRRNLTTVDRTIILVGGGAGTATSATANTYHVFPQFADGRFSDGTFYQTTVMITNPSDTAGATCALTLRGLTLPGFNTNYTMAKSGWIITATAGSGAFQSGYASLQCSAAVEAQLLYSYYSQSGTKLSEATVFSSPPSSAVAVLSDERENAQLGLAIANDSDQTVTYTISAGSVAGPVLTLAPKSSIAKFVRDFVPRMTPNTVSAIVVSAGSTAVSVVGLRYTGSVFTTIPQNQLTPAGATASTYHVFPQFADGAFGDGTFYRTTRMYLNPSLNSGTSCVTRLRGLTTNGIATFTSNLSARSFIVSTTGGTQAFQSGYATMECAGTIEAQALYSLYGPNGQKLSEATVFSSPSAKSVQILADSRGGAQVGLALANDSDQTNTYTITVSDADGNVVGSTTQELGPRMSVAKFVNQLVPLPPNYYGAVVVTSSTGTASIIGLRFTGSIFTTIPQTIRSGGTM